jgi:hypothetical protein
MSEDFKGRRGGWGGHHTKLESDPDTRTFEIEIKSPDGLICKGTVSFSITVEKSVDTTIKLGDVTEATLLKGGSLGLPLSRSSALDL